VFAVLCAQPSDDVVVDQHVSPADASRRQAAIVDAVRNRLGGGLQRRGGVVE
jgi:type IV pilus biogenesis protein CpaD/CtpE